MDEATLNVPARLSQLERLYGDPQTSAADLLCDRHEPGRTAFRFVSADLAVDTMTFAELREESIRFAGALAALGVGPGDRVATLMSKSRALVVALVAIWRVGAVHVPLFTAFAGPAVTFRLQASRCKIVVCDVDQAHKVVTADAPDLGCQVVTVGGEATAPLNFHALSSAAPAPPPRAALGGQAPLVQIFTSGTTGRPKAVLMPLRAVAALVAYQELGLDVRADDVFWNAADPGWAYGLYYGIIAPLATGLRSTMLTSAFSPELTMAVLDGLEVTNFAAAPTVYRALRASGLRPRAALRCASSAGEPLTPEVNTWAREVLGVEVRDHYGQTETGMLINNHQHPALRRPVKPGSIGRSMPGWSAQILKQDVDEVAVPGEIGRLALDLTDSPLAWFDGYADDTLKSAEKFSADGRWYLTGDVGRSDEEGEFYFSSRDDDVIIMAGYRIGPFDVESVLVTHPSVAECAVVAAPDTVRGEVVEAVVVLRPGHAAGEALTKELQTWVKDGYAAHAYPRRIHYVPDLPKTPSGKVQRFLLRQQLRDLRGAVERS